MNAAAATMARPLRLLLAAAAATSAFKQFSNFKVILAVSVSYTHLTLPTILLV